MARQKLQLNSIGYAIKDHLRASRGFIILACLACLFGLIIGIILVRGERSYLGLLTSGDQNLLKYISGSASIMQLLWKRVLSGLLCVCILFVCCLHFYSHFIAYAYLGYQSALLAIICGTVISFNGFAGIINFVFLLLPANLILLAFYIVAFSVFARRAYLQHRHKLSFGSSFTHDDFLIKLTLLALAFLAISLVFNLLVPLLIKAVYFVIY